jgi:hypothetical protein
MPVEITNKIRSTSLIKVTEGTASGSAIAANIAISQLAASNNETITSASIKGVMWTSNTAINVIRNGEVVLCLQGSGEMRLDDFAYSIKSNNTSNIEITSAGARGTIILEVSKEATYSPTLEGM